MQTFNDFIYFSVAIECSDSYNLSLMKEENAWLCINVWQALMYTAAVNMHSNFQSSSQNDAACKFGCKDTPVYSKSQT